MSLSSNTSSPPTVNNTTQAQQILPLLDSYTSSIMVYMVGVGLGVLTGILGIFSNAANICVYLKMGIKETTNMNFFALSVFDLLVCMSTSVTQILYNTPISDLKMPSGAHWAEVGISALYVSYPCLGCSAWVTAVLSVERYLCIAMPLKVKDILTPQRTRAPILIMAAYQSVFLVLFLVYPGPPYDVPNDKRTLYFNYSFSAPTFICFFIVSISTILLIIRLRRSLEWRHKSSTQSTQGLGSGNSKEKKATRSVLAICTIFIACFSLNIGVFFVSALYRRFNHLDSYLGSLFNAIYSFSIFSQVLCSSVNILVYYNMSSKYREVFNSMFCQDKN